MDAGRSRERELARLGDVLGCLMLGMLWVLLSVLLRLLWPLLLLLLPHAHTRPRRTIRMLALGRLLNSVQVVARAHRRRHAEPVTLLRRRYNSRPLRPPLVFFTLPNGPSVRRLRVRPPGRLLLPRSLRRVRLLSPLTRLPRLDSILRGRPWGLRRLLLRCQISPFCRPVGRPLG